MPFFKKGSTGEKVLSKGEGSKERKGLEKRFYQKAKAWREDHIKSRRFGEKNLTSGANLERTFCHKRRFGKKVLSKRESFIKERRFVTSIYHILIPSHCSKLKKVTLGR